VGVEGGGGGCLHGQISQRRPYQGVGDKPTFLGGRFAGSLDTLFARGLLLFGMTSSSDSDSLTTRALFFLGATSSSDWNPSDSGSESSASSSEDDSAELRKCEQGRQR